MRIRARLTSDGKIKVKVPGRKSQLFKVPFYDRHRRKAFRNLMYVLKLLNFKVDGEKTVRRYVDLKVDGEDMSAQISDSALLARFSPTKEVLERYPGLTERDYEVTFLYEGDGRFQLAFLCGNDEEYDALKAFLREVLKPLYDFALLNDAALKRLTCEEDRSAPEPKEPEPEEKKPPEVEVKDKAERQVRKRARRKRRKKPKAEPSIGDLKSVLGGYKPRSFKEYVAFERYREALETSPDDEDELHRLFYKLINTKDYEVFYRQLYTIAPKLHRKVEHGID